VAATVATTMATTMAATMATSVTAVAAAVAIARTAIATATRGAGFVLTAHQGDSNDRDKGRDTQNYRAIHLRILLQGTETYGSEKTTAVLRCPGPNCDGGQLGETSTR
jgi:hypothetical protein